MEQPSNAPTAKVTAASAAGAFSILVVFLLGEFDVHISPEAAAAITTLLAFVGGYFKRETGPIDGGSQRGLTLLETIVVLLVVGLLLLAVIVLT